MEPSHLVDVRHQWILDRLAEDRRVGTNDIASRLDVSVDTIRRDLRALHSRGLLRRVHGGAVPRSALPSSFTERSEGDTATRSRLALAVADRFEAGLVVGLDAGSTNVEVARHIPYDLDITIISNSPAVAVALADHAAATVVLLGGTVDLTWMAVTGPSVVEGWSEFRLDLAVVGACGLDPDIGVTTRSQQEVATKRALISASAETITPVQSEKLNTQAPFVVADINSVDTLIVETSADSKLVERCRQLGLSIHTV